MLLKCWKSARCWSQGVIYCCSYLFAHIFPVTFSYLRKSLVLASDPSLQERARAARATDRSDNGCSNQSIGNLFILTLDFYIFPLTFTAFMIALWCLDYCTIVVHEPTAQGVQICLALQFVSHWLPWFEVGTLSRPVVRPFGLCDLWKSPMQTCRTG